MAKYIPSAMIGELKGSIGSQAFQGGNVNSIIRNKSYRTGTKSTRKNYANASLAQVSTFWKTLSAGDRATWTAAAALWTFIDGFGRPYFGTPYQCFTAYNLNNLSYGRAIASTPNTYNLVDNQTPWTVDPSIAAGFDMSPSVVSALSQFAIVYASPMYSPGRNINNPRLKKLNYYILAGVTDFTILNDYQQAYSSAVIGTQIILKIILVNKDYPYYYFPQTLSFIVTA